MYLNENGTWYHGSPLLFDVLAENSTITQWKELAEAFSHKPNMVCIDNDEQILHNGLQYGYLYEVDEAVIAGMDIYEHPRSTMGKNIEFLTTRPLRVKLLCHVGYSDAKKVEQAEALFREYLKNRST
jgi:hypothetical protein